MTLADSWLADADTSTAQWYETMVQFVPRQRLAGGTSSLTPPDVHAFQVLAYRCTDVQYTSTDVLKPATAIHYAARSSRCTSVRAATHPCLPVPPSCHHAAHLRTCAAVLGRACCFACLPLYMPAGLHACLLPSPPACLTPQQPGGNFYLAASMPPQHVRRPKWQHVRRNRQHVRRPNWQHVHRNWQHVRRPNWQHVRRNWQLAFPFMLNVAAFVSVSNPEAFVCVSNAEAFVCASRLADSHGRTARHVAGPPRRFTTRPHFASPHPAAGLGHVRRYYLKPTVIT
eukprot:81324-Chlamydomonas_euryale.AAC.2